jgi:hypothetical protein
MKPLNSIFRSETIDLELVHPKTGEGLRSFLILAGPDHPTRRRLELEIDQRIRSELNKSGRVEVKSLERVEKDDIEFATACTLGWYTLEEGDAGDGTPPVARRVDMIDVGNGPEPFSVGRAKEIYQDRKLSWVFAQVREGIKNVERFFVDSSGS